MLKVENAETSAAIIQDEIRRNPEARYEHRLHAVLLVSQGMSGVRVATLMGDSVRAVEGWVKSFNKEGFSALFDEQIPGRPSRITPDLLKEIGSRLRRSPEESGLSCALWDGKALSHWLQTNKGITGVCPKVFLRGNTNRALADPRKPLHHERGLRWEICRSLFD